MKTSLKTRLRLLAALGLGSIAMNGYGQSADAIIDKLVEKGILTVKEANQLREDADKNFTQAYSVKSGMPDWVSALRFNGDLRGRFEGFYGENGDFVDRNRFRYRLRFGVTANLFDNLEVGLRLTSSDPASGGSFGGDPISGNTTFTDNASKKFVYLDLAYAKWNPINRPDWSATFIVGKMENPFVFSDMVFDADYTPEGIGMQWGYTFNEKHVAKLNAGAYVVDELGGSRYDPFWAGVQGRLDSAWSKKVQTTAGVAWLVLANEDKLTQSGTTWTIPNQNAGNNRSTDEDRHLTEEYTPIVADFWLTYNLDKFFCYNAAFPIRVGGEYMYNTGADTQNSGYQVGVTFGKSGKRGLWELSYRYKYLEGDAWFEEFVDSDFGAFYAAGTERSAGATGYIAGTNVKGHVIRASYSPFDSWTLGVTAFLTELIQPGPDDPESGMTRLQLDAVWKF
jgi:hypothetical protein